ncbi:hypothetical protein [Roseivivax sp. CAU 1761]
MSATSKPGPRATAFDKGSPAGRKSLSVLLLSGSLCALAPGAVWADGTFFQLDLSANASDAVLAATRGSMSFGANHSTYEGGWSAGFHATRDFVIDEVATVKLGPSLGIGEDMNPPEIGGKIIIERYQPMEFGFVFLSGQYNTIASDWFALVQVGDGKKLSVDFTAGGSDTYSEKSIAVNYRFREGPTRFRMGYRFEAQEIFAGISINTY